MHRFFAGISRKISTLSRRYVVEAALIIGFLAIIALFASSVTPYQERSGYSLADSAETSTELYRAQVESVSPTEMTVTLQDGPSKGLDVTIPLDESSASKPLPSTQVVVLKNEASSAFVLYDRYRIPVLLMIVAVFIVLVVLIGRKRGLMSLAGLGSSVIVIGWAIVPAVAAGYNSFLVSILGAYLIAIVSILLAHGFNLRSYISLGCIMVILVLITFLSYGVIGALGLTGLLDETAYYLKLNRPEIDLSGILLGGIVIATLGALDDIVTTQVATVDELKKANRKLGVRQLFKKASSVGGEHIAALVNTLALVYVGASLPLVVGYAVSSPDMFTLLNGEAVATEVARIVLVSIGLVASVPLSTYVAAVVLSKYYEKNNRAI